MGSYKKVLVAVDIYDQFPKILDNARYFKEQGSEVHLCTAVAYLESAYAMGSAHSMGSGGGIVASAKELQGDLKANAQRCLKELADEIGIKQNHTHVLIGKASTEIKTLAEGSAFDLIVLGTHGKATLRAMLGSTSNGVLHNAPCDVLAVKYAAS